MIEIFDQSGAGQFVTVTKENAFYYYPYNDLYVPRMKVLRGCAAFQLDRQKL